MSCDWCGGPITGTALTWAHDVTTTGATARYCTVTCMDAPATEEEEPARDLAYVIENAVADYIPGWQYSYSERVAAAVRKAGWTKTSEESP